MKRGLSALCVVLACASAHAGGYTWDKNAGTPYNQVQAQAAAGQFDWALAPLVAEYKEACLQEAKALVAAVEQDPMELAKARLAAGASSLGQFRLGDNQAAFSDARCFEKEKHNLPEPVKDFCGVSGRVQMCASVLSNRFVTHDAMQAVYTYSSPTERWWTKKGLPSTGEAVKIAAWVAKGGEPVDIQKMSTPSCRIAENDTRQNMTGGGPGAGGITANNAGRVNTCLKLAADDGGVIKAVGVIHTRYAGFLHRTTLNQEHALIYLSKVMQNEQQDAKKHPLYPIFEKAAKEQ